MISNYALSSQGYVPSGPDGLRVSPVAVQMAVVPTLNQWGLIALSGALILIGVVFLRRRATVYQKQCKILKYKKPGLLSAQAFLCDI